MRKKIITCSVVFFMLVDAVLIYLALTITPVTLRRNHFTYEYGEVISTDPAYYFDANNNILLNIKLDLTAVSNQVGIYQANGTYNNKVFQFEIEVKDTQKPKVELKQVEYDINVNTKIYAKNMIKSVEDQSATEVYFVDESTNTLSKYKQYSVAGSYIERIVVRDAYGNQSASLRVKISVHDNNVPPILYGVEDITIQQHSMFYSLMYVSAVDDLEGDISDRISCSGKVDIEKAGTYTIVYTVSDKAGNTAKVTRKITVKELYE